MDPLTVLFLILAGFLSGVAIALTIDYFLTRQKAQELLKAQDTGNASIAVVEKVGEEIEGARVVHIGLKNRAGKIVGGAEITCPGTSLSRGDRLAV